MAESGKKKKKWKEAAQQEGKDSSAFQEGVCSTTWCGEKGVQGPKQDAQCLHAGLGWGHAFSPGWVLTSWGPPQLPSLQEGCD